MQLFRLFAFCFVLVSCGKGDSVITFFNINEDHTISLTQTLSSSGGNLAFSIQTNQELKCNNLSLNHLINQNDDSVTLWLNGYDTSKKCSNIPGIVNTNIPLNPYQRSLNLKIIMKYESAIEKKGTLDVDNGIYSFNIDNDFGIISKNNAIRLVEVNTYWGQLWATDGQYLLNNSQIEALFLKYNISKLTEGDYSFFTVNNAYTTIQDQAKEVNSIQFAGKISKTNFTQFLNELNIINKSKYMIRSFEDKTYEK
jgi:hypothetical protein